MTYSIVFQRSSFAFLMIAWLSACESEAPVRKPAPRPAIQAPSRPTATVVPSASSPDTIDLINPRLLRRFRQIAGAAATPPDKPEVVALGRMLWYDARLSRSGTLSCNSCHELGRYGVDGRVTSPGDEGKHGRRNTPTVYNAATQFAQFWDGRAATIEEQAKGPLLGATEMAATEHGVEGTLRAIPGYREAFARAFPSEHEPVRFANVASSIGAFERGLVTRSRWDNYLSGETSALSSAERHGLKVFLDVGCMGCHTGPQVGASMFQVAGFVEPWPSQRDLGRYEITHRQPDRMMFKVPTLKNVAETAPYFHDGSSDDLPEAVRQMARRQLGIDLEDDEIASIVTFLNALTGELPKHYIAPPSLPPGPETAELDKLPHAKENL